MPDSKVIFSRNVWQATTTFSNGQWVTTVPVNYGGGNIFLSGLGWQLPNGLAGGQNATWSGTFTSDTPGVTVDWQWGAAAYNGFGSSPGGLNIKPVDGSGWDSWGNSDHAGTREGGHFRVEIVSERFRGRSPLERHRLVYEAVGELFGRDIHALSIIARTPEELT